MKNAYIIHGAFGNPEENWIPWLKGELERHGHEVTVPSFPTPEEQNYDNWMEIIKPHLKNFNEETVLVGHSIGATFTLCILEKLDVQIGKTVLVSGFLGSLGNGEFDTANRTIAERSLDWNKIKENSNEFYVFHGSDDPYVPQEKPIELGKKLDITPIFVENGGHLNESAGFTTFPQLLDTIS